MFDVLAHLNYLAIGVAALATFFLGALWYQALFGKLWLSLHGYTPEQVQAMQKERPAATFFGIMILAYVLLAFTLAVLIELTRANSWPLGAGVGLFIWIALQCVAATDYITSKTKLGVFLLDGSYQLIYCVMMGAILGGWR